MLFSATVSGIALGKELHEIMSEDTFTEVSHTGWLSRIGKSITGMLVGLILTVGSFPLLWWNEGRSVKTYQGLVEGEKVCVEASAEAIDPANDGKLVHTSARAEAKDAIADPVFGLQLPGTAASMRISAPPRHPPNPAPHNPDIHIPQGKILVKSRDFKPVSPVILPVISHGGTILIPLFASKPYEPHHNRKRS
jgi:hypothetical protein